MTNESDLTQPILDELMSRSTAAPEKDRRRSGSEYLVLKPVVKMLRSKNYTHKAIHEWLKENGVAIPQYRVTKLAGLVD